MLNTKPITYKLFPRFIIYHLPPRRSTKPKNDKTQKKKKKKKGKGKGNERGKNVKKVLG